MSKRLRNTELCADCCVPEPRWASVNRGVLICDECCSVHRGLGRHSSQVRHLTHSTWPPTQLQVNDPPQRDNPDLCSALLFIRAKYQMLAFVHRMPCRDDDSSTAKDLSKQLHSSVRTGNLETCLRLLSLGAQANFFHPDKGNTPLHVAAKAGQVSQVELLTVYGADPGALDSNGKTPIDHARYKVGHYDLADRLVEIQYELTDRLAFYLCGRKPGKQWQRCVIESYLRFLLNWSVHVLYSTGCDFLSFQALFRLAVLNFLSDFDKYLRNKHAAKRYGSDNKSVECCLFYCKLSLQTSKLEKQSSVPESDYDNTFNDSEMDDSGRGRLRSSGWLGEGNSIPEQEDLQTELDPTLPSTEDVIRKTEQITKNIQELLRAAQDNKHDSFVPCSERIHVAVTEMAALFPKKPRSETVRGSLRLLTTSACRLQNECRKAVPLDGSSGPDMQLVTQQVIQCAYDIAKAAKQLVTITTKENTN
uniref:G protein-coupled receptor kinase interacting ArfGAP 2a n=1 Tax=Xiphophorus couchianus TaxID=32473 RepID=A0A3B5MNW9_9TELE